MDVNLWFARNQNEEIVSIINSNKEDEYICPICASKVIPKAVESKKKSPHFAHIDVSKCNGEAMIHWWYKNKFIQKGDKFKIFTDKEIEFTCKDFKTEVTYQLDSGTYRPDLVVETECGQEIVFEMANTNKKMVKDYIDRWIELDKIIVEVDIKSLQNVDDVKKFNVLYYNGKCFNFNKRDGGYYNTIGKLKEEMKSSGNYDIEMVKKLDWLWDDLLSYVKERDFKIFDSISFVLGNYNLLSSLVKLIKLHKLKDFKNEYTNYLKKSIYIIIKRKTNLLDFKITFNEYQYENEYFSHPTHFTIIQNNIESPLISVKDVYYNFDNVLNGIELLLWRNIVSDFCESIIQENKDIEITYNFKYTHCNIHFVNRNKRYSRKILSFDYKDDFEDIRFKINKTLKTLNNSIYISNILNKLHRNKYDSKLCINLNKIINDSNYYISHRFNEEDFTIDFNLFYKDDKIKSLIDVVKVELDFLKDVNIIKLSKHIIPKFVSSIQNVKVKNKYTNLYKKLELNKWKTNLDCCDIKIYPDENNLKMFLFDYINEEKYIIELTTDDKLKIGDKYLTTCENIGTNEFIECIEEYFVTNIGLECIQCKEVFLMNNSEYQFFKKKGFEFPKRCKSCRNKRKKERLND